MSQIAPVSLGIINMNVTIGGVSPTRRRNRQSFSYVFNQASLSVFNFKDKNRIEAIGDASTGEFGITLKGSNPYRFHNWLAFFDTYEESSSNVASANITSDSSNAWVNPAPTSYEEKIEKPLFFYSAEGAYEWDVVNAAKVEHFLFVPDGSLFRAGINTDAEARTESEWISDSSDLQERMLTFYRHFVPYHREVKISGAHIDSGSSDLLCSASDIYKFNVGTKVGGNLSPTTPMPILQFLPFKPCDVARILQEGEDICIQTAGKRYITFDNVFTDNVVEMDPRGWKNIRSRYKHPTANGNVFGAPVSQKTGLISNYVHPGIHAKYRKYSPIFRGMDFEISFKSMAKEAAVAKTGAPDSNSSNTNMLWGLRDRYSIIDAARNPDFSDIALGQNVNMPFNNSVCYLAKNKDNQTVIDPRSSGYYLADQPYVVVEVDGGTENRFFLIIPDRGNVIFCEGTRDLEIIDYVDESQAVAGTNNGSKKIVQENLYHSRILYDFGFPGRELLNKDSFVIRFQHLGGKLGVSFGHETSLHIISRLRWVNADGEALINRNALIAGNPQARSKDYNEWRDNNSNATQDISALMLEGNLNIAFGNKKLAFILNPIEYPSSANLAPALPAGIMGLDGYGPAVNVLLRSRGGPERPSTYQASSAIGGIIENEDGPINFTSPLTPLATRNIAHAYRQQINGEPNVFYHTDLPKDFRAVIPLDPAYSKSSSLSSAGQWYSISDPSRIMTAYRISNLIDFSNHVMPLVQLRAGSVALQPVSFTKQNSSADNQSVILSNCLRPILKDFELFVSEGGSASPMFQSEAVDIVGQVMKYSEQMSEQNRETIKHTASLDLFLNFESASRVLEVISRIRVNDLPSSSNAQSAANNGPRSSEILGGTSVGNSIATDDFLASLQDKYFYLRIRAHRSADTAGSYGQQNGWFWGTKDNQPPDGINDVLFTGLCVRSAFTIEAKGVRMSCTLADYSEILENSVWIQPSFYDAMRDYNAVLDVLNQAGFYAGERDPMYDPAALVKRLAESSNKEEYYTIDYDGEEILVNDYVLPGSYDMLQSPRFKASKFEPYTNILSKMAKVAGKIMYFDRLGVMHYDVPEDELENAQRINASSGRKSMYTAPIYDKFSITMKAKNNPARNDASSPASSGSTPAASVEIDLLNVSDVDDVNWWNVVTGVSYTFSRLTDSVRNEIRIYSSSPDMSIKMAFHLNKASMYDPTTPGFIGYRKMFVQKSGFFGSEEAVRKIASRYTTMMNPPVEASFSIPGRVGLRPMQTVVLDGVGPGAFKLLLREVSNEIDPKTNTWFTNVKGRYLMPAERIEFRKKNTYQIGV